MTGLYATLHPDRRVTVHASDMPHKTLAEVHLDVPPPIRLTPTHWATWPVESLHTARMWLTRHGWLTPTDQPWASMLSDGTCIKNVHPRWWRRLILTLLMLAPRRARQQ